MEFNAAPGLCGVTGAVLYFFKLSRVVDDLSLALATWAFALEAKEVFFGHSPTLCPAPPQNMQWLLANQQVCSSEVSLLSFPSLLERLGFLFCLEEPDKSGLGLLLDEEVDLLLEDWFLYEDDVELADLLNFCLPNLFSDFLDSWETSD